MKKEDLMLLFGKHFRKKRLEKGVSLGELALRIENMDKQMISKIERGVQNPNLFTIYRLCSALDITISDLMKDFKYKSK